MIKLAPSILAADFSILGEQIKIVDNAGCDYIHIDVMDGKFVPNISFGIPVIKSVRKCTKKPFDVHLMIEEPIQYIDAFIDAGADIITVHVEACKHLHRTISYIKEAGIKVGVSINPATSLNVLEYVLKDLDMILIMTVDPGYGGQKFIDFSLDKIRRLREIIISKGLECDIQVDGGIDTNNVHKVIKAGANVIVAGSSIYNVPDIKKRIREFKEIFRKETANS